MSELRTDAGTSGDGGGGSVTSALTGDIGVPVSSEL